MINNVMDEFNNSICRGGCLHPPENMTINGAMWASPPTIQTNFYKYIVNQQFIWYNDVSHLAS